MSYQLFGEFGLAGRWLFLVRRSSSPKPNIAKNLGPRSVFVRSRCYTKRHLSG